MNAQMTKFDQHPCIVLAKIFGPPEASRSLLDYTVIDRLAAGSVLLARSLDEGVGVVEWISAKAHVAAAAVIRAGDQSPAKIRAQAAEMLANVMCRGGKESIFSSGPCMISCVGAFCMDTDTLTIHNSCTMLCVAAQDEVWGPCLEHELFVERFGLRLFQLCCALDGSEVKRTSNEELLVAKMFELAWRLRYHRRCKAFDKLCELDGHECLLAAAISYLYDPGAHERNFRHYRDGPVSDLCPSGLDSCLRMMEGVVLYDIRRKNPKGRSRLLRAVDALRALRATRVLSGNEQISCEVVLVTATHTES